MSDPKTDVRPPLTQPPYNLTEEQYKDYKAVFAVFVRILPTPSAWKSVDRMTAARSAWDEPLILMLHADLSPPATRTAMAPVSLNASTSTHTQRLVQSPPPPLDHANMRSGFGH